MAKSKAERWAEIHAESIDEFDRVQMAMRDERMQCLQDRRFYSVSGAQWEGPLGDQWENKPRLEFNKVHLSVIRVINEYRNNRVTVDFIPKDGTTNADLAETCNGLYRADEHDSGAQEAYDNAFEEATGGGFGAWRLRACYEDEEDDENEQQRVRIEPIYDADSSVYFDLDSKRQDKSDARRCWVLSSMTHARFKEEYGHSPSTWPKTVTQRYFDWYTPDVVYVAEYYRVEETTELVHVYRGLDGQETSISDEEFRDDDDREMTLLATGYREVRQKRIKRKRVRKYIMSGAKIESDEGYIPGNCIPIVPVYGKRWFVDNVERCMGHVRLAKDAQRLTNSLLSWLTELAARFDMEKPILTPEQILGHENMWAEDNIKRFPYLLANLLRDLEGNPIPGSNAPTAYTKAPSVPPAMAALIQIASAAMDDLLGNQQAGEEVHPNISGKVVELVQQRLDMQSYIYLDNFGKAAKRSGEIWLSMAKEVMPEEGRQMKTIDSTGGLSTVTLKQPTIDADTEALEYDNDLDDAKFDVWVDVGPSSQSQRQATVRSLTNLSAITEDPQMKQALTLAAMSNLEGEGLSDLKDWARVKGIQIGIIKPTDEERQELEQQRANTPPDPQAQFLLASAQQASADAQQSRAKAVQALTDADLKRAQTAKTQAETLGEHVDQRLASLQTLHQMLLAQPAQGF